MLRAGTRFLCAGLVMGLSLAAAAAVLSPAPETPKVTEFYVRYQGSAAWLPSTPSSAGIQRSNCLERPPRVCRFRVCADTTRWRTRGSVGTTY